MNTDENVFRGAITSPNTLRKIYNVTSSINKACGILILLISETGIPESRALHLSVKEMKDFVNSTNCELTEDTKNIILDYCANREDADRFFCYQNRNLTKDIVERIYYRVSKLYPSKRITTLSLRKTYYWNKYLKAPSKIAIMRQLQITSLEDLAQFFDVPIESLTPKSELSAKTLILTENYVDTLLKETKALLENIENTYRNSLNPDKYYLKLVEYLRAIDAANNRFLSEIPSLDILQE